MTHDRMDIRSSLRRWMILTGIINGIILTGGIALLVSPNLREKAFSLLDRGGVRGAGSNDNPLRRKVSRQRQKAQATFERLPRTRRDLRRDVTILESSMDRSFDL